MDKGIGYLETGRTQSFYCHFVTMSAPGRLESLALLETCLSLLWLLPENLDGRSVPNPDLRNFNGGTAAI